MSARSALAQDSDADHEDLPGVILIAGGGIGGLCLALALARHNIPSHVFERRETFEPEGAGIQVGPNGSRILIALGLEAAICVFAGQPRAVVAHDGLLGDEIVRMPVGIGNNPHHSAPYWTMHRAQLHRALLAAVHDSPLIRLSMGQEVLRAETTDDGIEITLSDTQKHAGRVLVAADGIHSRLRKAKISDQPVLAAGKSAARTVVPATSLPNGLDVDNVGLWLAPGAHVVHYPVCAGRDVALVAIFDDEDVSSDWTTPISQDWVLSRCGSLHNNVQQVLNAGTNWQKWSLAHLAPLRTWRTDHMTLLGDAAHPILPFLAQGAVMALEDAMVLADCLVSMPSNIDRTLKTYESRRRRRTARVARASVQNGRIYHQRGVTATVRNRAMGVLGGAALIRRYNWLYNWSWQ
ncbi:MAG: FAD-dependent monooxygenase [Alphaproteobacteria bacterium]|nr:FAD-dependent monooxygenase [Alphaproteobacteria bacterium]